MNSKNDMRKSAVETGKRAAFVVVAAVLLTLPLYGQHTPNSVPTVESVSPNPQANAAAPQTDEQIVQELAAMKKRIEQLELALKQHEAAEQPNTVVHTAKANTPVGVTPSAAVADVTPLQAEAVLPAPGKPAKAEPFAFADWTWLNGNARTKDTRLRFKILHPGDPRRHRLHLRFQPSRKMTPSADRARSFDRTNSR